MSAVDESPRPVALLRLMQLCSPALPIGAFAYSQGLEHAVERSWVTDGTSLRAWCSGLLQNQLAHTDLPLLKLAMELWSSDSLRDAHSDAIALTRRVLAFRETSELRAEELLLGRSLARLLTHLGEQRAQAFVDADEASYVVLFGLAASHFCIPVGDALAGFAFAWVENQMAVAPRVMRIGQLGIQEVLSSLIADVHTASEKARHVPNSDIGYSSPGLFLASAGHETQYSRLFRS